MNADTAVKLGKLALAFGRVNRATFHEDGVRPETDTDHTVMLGIISVQVAYDLGWGRYERGMVAQYVMVHDLVEAKVGEVNSFDISSEAKAYKDWAEAKALGELKDEFGESGRWLIHLIVLYEKQVEPEARLVRYLDKAMPKITHFLNGCFSIKRMGKSKEDLFRAHDKQFNELNAQYPEFAGTEVEVLLRSLMAKSVGSY